MSRLTVSGPPYCAPTNRMPPRFSEVSTPLEAAAKSETAVFLRSINTTKWVEDIHRAVNFSNSTSNNMGKVTRAISTTFSTVGMGHYVLFCAFLLLIVKELLVRVLVRRSLARTHVD
jgi:hypothetical protein